MVFGKKLGRLGASKRNTVGPTSGHSSVPPSSETQAPSHESVPPSIVPSSVPPEIVNSSETQPPSPSQPNVHYAEMQAPSPSQRNILSPTSQTSVAGASSSRRVQGPTVGKRTDKLLAANGGNRLYVPIVEGLNALGSELSTPAANELGIYIRRMCPIQSVNSWADVELVTKAAIVQSVRTLTLTQHRNE